MKLERFYWHNLLLDLEWKYPQVAANP